MDKDILDTATALIREAQGGPIEVTSCRPVGGGDIHHSLQLQTRTGERYFIKHNRRDCLPLFEAEAAGLELLRRADALAVPRCLGTGCGSRHALLVLPWLDTGTPTAQTARQLGEGLAAMHGVTAASFGNHRDNFIGSTPQSNRSRDEGIEFLREERLQPMLTAAARQGVAAAVVRRGELLLLQLPAFFSDYRPSPSLLHGDLWGGNWLCDSGGQPWLIDPAAHFGDREADLAMTELFGGFDPGFYSAYRDSWPPAPGYAVRRDLHQLYHLLNHFLLFGGSYAGQCAQLIERALANAGH